MRGTWSTQQAVSSCSKMAEMTPPTKRKKRELDERSPVSDVCGEFLKLERELCDDLRGLSFISDRVSCVYNPLLYARSTHEDYVRKYCRGQKKVLFLGMNPGPFGMAQNGVPFGDTNHVKNWLKVEGQVDQPAELHPKRPIEGLDCNRSEVSGSRFWGFFKEHCQTAETFFRNCFVHNYCPLVFMAKTGKNVTPPQLLVRDRKELFRICDEFLQSVVQLLRVEVIVGVGKFAVERVQASLKDLDNDIRVECLMHPSPMNPATNQGWGKIALQQLRDSNVMCFVTGGLVTSPLPAISLNTSHSPTQPNESCQESGVGENCPAAAEH